MRILDACMKVLEDASGPMTADEIFDEVNRRELFEFGAKDPKAILRSTIRAHLRRDPPHLIRETEKGKFEAVRSR